MKHFSSVLLKGLQHGSYIGATGDTTRLKQMKKALMFRDDEKKTGDQTDSNDV